LPRLFLPRLPLEARTAPRLLPATEGVEEVTSITSPAAGSLVGPGLELEFAFEAFVRFWAGLASWLMESDVADPKRYEARLLNIIWG